MTAKPSSRTLRDAVDARDASGVWAAVRSWLAPGGAEKDPGFRADIERLSERSLVIIAGVCVLMPITGALFHWMASFFEDRPIHEPWVTPGYFAVALGLWACSRWEWGRRHARMIALASGWAATMVGIWGEYLGAADPVEAQFGALVYVVVVLLVCVAAIPVRPLQILALGAVINVSHYWSSMAAVRFGLVPGLSLHHYAGLDLVSLLCMALSAVLYQRMLEHYHARRAEVEASARLLISDNAASMGRFAATLAHELNSPLGALASAVDSLHRVEERWRDSTPAETAHLKAPVRDLLATARQATDSLRRTARRIERFTGLDRAEIASVDVGQMVEDVAAVTAPGLDPRLSIEVDCAPVPALSVSPQRMSAVLARLLRYSAEAGGERSRIRMTARVAGAAVEIAIANTALPYDAGEAERLFEPAFRVRDTGEVGVTWSLFNSRQAVRELGGDIALLPEGEGSALTVRLPIGEAG